MYTVHRFERQAFDNANREGRHQIAYIAAPLDPTTVPLAEGCAAVIPSPHDGVDAATLQLLAERGVKLIALRSAGYNNLDLAAAARLGFKSVYVPAYTVAELVFALTFALIRQVPRAYQRTRDENFTVEGLVGTQLNGRTVGLGKIGRVVAGIAKRLWVQSDRRPSARRPAAGTVPARAARRTTGREPRGNSARAIDARDAPLDKCPNVWRRCTRTQSWSTPVADRWLTLRP
jgi:lactate dehydrogenase-like 2-hydroxyacid dehydrogenase